VLSDAERQLLEAVDTAEERLRLVETDAGLGQLRDGCRMMATWNDEGTGGGSLEPTVLVGGLARSAVAGLVRYIGRLSGRNGVWFGIELSPVSKLSNSDFVGCSYDCVADFMLLFLAVIFKRRLLVQYAALPSCHYCSLCMCCFTSTSWQIK